MHGVALIALLAVGQTLAQQYPAKPIRMLVTAEAASGPDIAALAD
jgi:tripartite-type tricarboxylate transporter receptor subunit TctC